MNTQLTMDKIVALAKNRGFVYPGSEIYGGLANTWDYGPLGVEFKNNVKKAWWRKFVQESKYNVGLDAAILMNPKTWVASGHVGNFADPLIDCKACKSRFRADKLIEAFADTHGMGEMNVDGWPHEKMSAFIEENKLACPECGKADFTGIRQFNLMFKTFQGVTEDSKSELYLRRKQHRVFLSTLRVCSEPREKRFRSALRRSVNRSATRSLRVTLRSERVSLNKWNSNFSAARIPIWSGLNIGEITASTS